MGRSLGFILEMGVISRAWLALALLGACSVPSFGIAPDPVDTNPIMVDACTTQMTATGKACGGDCPVCANGANCADRKSVV